MRIVNCEFTLKSATFRFAGGNLPEQGQIVGAGRFVERDADGFFVNRPQINFMLLGNFQHVGGLHAFQLDADGIKNIFRRDLMAEFFQALRQDVRQHLHARGDLLQAFRPVINGIERRHVGEQRLRGADVARGFLTADMLLACA